MDDSNECVYFSNKDLQERNPLDTLESVFKIERKMSSYHKIFSQSLPRSKMSSRTK